MTLPYDYTRCVTEGCELARTCLRQLSLGQPGYQSFASYPGGPDCHGYISPQDWAERFKVKP